MAERVSAKVAGKKVFTTGDVAKLCRVSARTAAGWFDSGQLKGYRLPVAHSGPGVDARTRALDRRVPRDDLLRFMKAHGFPADELEGEAVYTVLLVAADDATAGRLAALLPECDGFRVERAAGPFAAGVAFRDFRPAAVVVDLAVGRSEAEAVAAFVRDAEQGAEKQTLLVALAGEDGAGARVGYRSFDDYFVQPVDPALLAERLRRGKGE